MITYTEIHGSSTVLFNVRLDGKRVGVIRRGPLGFYYKPTGGPSGDSFPSIEAVKQSIEG